MISKLAACGKNGKKNTYKHACRNLHGLIHKEGLTMPVSVTPVKTLVRLYGKNMSRRREVEVNLPTLMLSSWIKTILEQGGHFLLGGHSVDDFATHADELYSFWCKYRKLDPTLPFYNDVPESEWQFSLPLAIHGDKGRGRYKRPIMVVAFQPLIPAQEGLSGWGLSKYVCDLVPLIGWDSLDPCEGYLLQSPPVLRPAIIHVCRTRYIFGHIDCCDGG